MMDARHTPRQGEEPRGELEAPTSRSADDLGGGHSAPAEARPDAGLAKSPWAKVVGKGAAFFAGMLGLAAIGAWSQIAGAGVPVPMPPRPSADAHGVWLAGSAAPPGATASAAPPNAPTPAPAPAEVPGSGGANSTGVTSDGRVILNTATVEDLQKLPRVGRKRAEAILELRKKLGKFRKATELLRVRGIGPKGLRLMLPKLVVDPPSA